MLKRSNEGESLWLLKMMKWVVWFSRYYMISLISIKIPSCSVYDHKNIVTVHIIHQVLILIIFIKITSSILELISKAVWIYAQMRKTHADRWFYKKQCYLFLTHIFSNYPNSLKREAYRYDSFPILIHPLEINPDFTELISAAVKKKI